MRSEAEGAASPPQAMVERAGDRTHTLRAGRGFSRSEVSEAGMSLLEAKMHGLRVDDRRRSKREENVVALRDWVMSIRKAAKPSKPKKEKKKRARPEKTTEERAVSKKPPKKKRRRTRAEPKRKKNTEAT